MSKRERRHASFYLDALVIVEMDVSINQRIGLVEGVGFVPVNTFGFEDGEEIFCHCVIIRIAFA